MRLEEKDNSFYINNKRRFIKNKITKEAVDKSFDFAYNMAFGKGHHREHRSGGNALRTPITVFKNTLQGKLAEIVLYNHLLSNGIQCNSVDFSVHGKGIWDDSDLEYKNIKISVKSAAYFSNLLLLETKDWDTNGNYIPNTNNPEITNTYDYFVLVRIKPNTNTLRNKNIDKSVLKSNIETQDWHYDIAGCCSLKTLKHIIKNNYIIPQNALLNGNIKMDAENYYIQAGDLKEIEYLIDIMRNLE